MISNVEFINIVLPLMILFAVMFFGMIFLVEWKNGRRRDYELKKEELNYKIKDTYMNNIENIQNNPVSDLGGYITIDMPEERKSVFQDILKGFEEYTALKGYKVIISSDLSIRDKISFKITIDEFGITTNIHNVKNDLNEFINKINNGESLEDLPQVISTPEHQRIIMALTNRINFLQQNYQMEKKMKEFYFNFFQNLPLNSISHQLPHIQIYNGSLEMDERKYIATNSSNVMQGDEQQNIIENNINIGNTLSQKQEKLKEIEDVIELINQEYSDNYKVQKVKRQFENIKEELSEEETPDKSFIKKALQKVNQVANTLEAGEKIVDKVTKVLESFNF